MPRYLRPIKTLNNPPTWALDKHIDLVDGVRHDRCWYFNDFENHRRSVEYPTKTKAMNAYDGDSIEWEVD